MEEPIRLVTIRKHSQSKSVLWKHRELFRLMWKKDLWEVAGKKIYRGKSSLSYPSDIFVDKKLLDLRTRVLSGRYDPVVCPEKIEDLFMGFSAEDYIVCEVIRMILEAVFSPLFSKFGFGFRKIWGPRQVLDYVEGTFRGCSWVLKVDAQNIYDFIDYRLLFYVIEGHIEDQRFVNLIRKLLNAGVVKSLDSRCSIFCTPIERTLSSILADIYFHEIDFLIHEEASYFKRFKRLALSFVRYGKCFLIGFNGDSYFAYRFKFHILKSFGDTIKSSRPGGLFTLVDLHRGRVSFLGYDIFLYGKMRGAVKFRNSSFEHSRLRFRLSVLSLIGLLKDIGVVVRTLKGVRPVSKLAYTHLEDFVILAWFRDLWLLILTYYDKVQFLNGLGYIYYLVRMSCAMTIAHRHRTTSTNIFRRRGKRLIYKSLNMGNPIAFGEIGMSF